MPSEEEEKKRFLKVIDKIYISLPIILVYEELR